MLLTLTDSPCPSFPPHLLCLFAFYLPLLSFYLLWTSVYSYVVANMKQGKVRVRIRDRLGLGLGLVLIKLGLGLGLGFGLGLGLINV